MRLSGVVKAFVLVVIGMVVLVGCEQLTGGDSGGGTDANGGEDSNGSGTVRFGEDLGEPGGEPVNVEVYFYIDVDGSGTGGPTDGDYHVNGTKPFGMSGDTRGLDVTVSYPGEFIEKAPNGTMTFSVSGAQSHDGDPLVVEAFAEGESPELGDTPVAMDEVSVSSGSASVSLQSSGSDHSFQGGYTYELFAFIDADASGSDYPTSGDPSFVGSKTIDGDLTVDTSTGATTRVRAP
jgi:hypothetical protein